MGASVENGHPCLTVTDSGPGIPASERQRVFDRFYRGQNGQNVYSDTGTSNGSGLGLAIVQAVAERHGAGIRLDEAPGGTGLRVTVSFPSP